MALVRETKMYDDEIEELKSSLKIIARKREEKWCEHMREVSDFASPLMKKYRLQEQKLIRNILLDYFMDTDNEEYLKAIAEVKNIARWVDF